MALIVNIANQQFKEGDFVVFKLGETHPQYKRLKYSHKDIWLRGVVDSIGERVHHILTNVNNSIAYKQWEQFTVIWQTEIIDSFPYQDMKVMHYRGKVTDAELYLGGKTTRVTKVYKSRNKGERAAKPARV